MLGSFFLLLIGYGLYEAQGVLYGPSIEMESLVRTTSEPLTYISGKAVRMSELRINGKKIAVTESGEFRELHVLAPGSNHFFLEVRDARRRTHTEEVTILYSATTTFPFPTPHVASTTATSSQESAYTVHGNRISLSL